MHRFSTFYAIYHPNPPLAIYTLTMDPPESSFVANSVINQFQEDFRGQETNVSQVWNRVNVKLTDCLIDFQTFKYHLTSTRLARGEAASTKNGAKMAKLKSFLTRSQDPKPNFLWIIDTHSCYKTGCLRHGTGSNNESLVAPINTVSV